MIRVFPDHETMSREAAARIITAGASALVDRDRFDLVLSGGRTPRRCYEVLAERMKDEPAFWNDTHLWWGDERCIDPDHPDSNYRLVVETLLGVIPVPDANVHRIEAERPDREAAAAEYESTFPAYPDLLLLGMGADGHVASLFPHAATLDERGRRFVTTIAPVEPAARITLTPRVITDARSILVLVSGREKTDALQRLVIDDDPHELPALLADSGTWFVTQDAAG